MFWKSNEEKKGKVKLQGCLDTSKDYIQHQTMYKNRLDLFSM